MKAIKVFAVLVIIVILGAWAIVKALTIHIPIGSVGVRVQQYALFGDKGTVKKDYGPGWHRDLGPIDLWEVYDSTVQTLEMTRNPRHGAVRGVDDVKVQSADGYAVSLDVTVKYRIQSGKAYQVYQDTGKAPRYREPIRTESQKACIGMFGRMKTEEFYDPTQRRQRAEEVKEVLAESLTDNFIEVVDVLIRDVQFDPEYERQIQGKKLADQKVELNKSEELASGARGKTEVVVAETQKLTGIIVKEKGAELITMQAETEREIAKIRADAEKYATQKRADADLVAAQNEAKGQLLVKKAEAAGERLRNDAMRGAGGGVIVALEAARNLDFADITISTLQIDVLDIDKMATKLGVPENVKK